MKSKQRKPNILFLMADQVAPSFLPAYGNIVAKTPCLDRLAERGTVFERAYCNNPLCAPSRFSFMSGKLGSEIGAYDNGSEFPAAVPTISHYLRALGYRTAISGKMHYIGPDQLHGTAERLTPDICSSSFAWTPDWQSAEFKDEYDTRLFTEIGIARRTAQHDHDEEATYRAVGKLYDWAREDDDRPFFLMTSLSHPHDPYIADQASWDIYSGDEIDLPLLPYGSIDSDPHSERLRDLLGINQIDWDDERVRTIRHAYYANISYVDTKFQQVLNALEDCGYADDTIIVFSSDHGDMMGERGLFQKRNFFENSVRVPLIISTPKRYQPGQRIEALVSLLDLLPTMVDLAGGSTEDHAEPLEGVSLLSIMEGSQLEQDRPIYAEMLSETTTSPLLMVRQGDWKFVWSMIDPPLLFDLKNDPHEKTNLANNIKLLNIAADFENKVLSRWKVEQLDQEVRASQQRRLLILKALNGEELDRWDEPTPASGKPGYFRNEQGYVDWATQGNLRR